MKTCSYCWEGIQDQAKKCRYCWEWINEESRQAINDIGEKAIKETKINNTKKTSKADFIENFIKDNENVGNRFIKYIVRLLKFLYCDRNRISWMESFVGYLRLWLMAAIHYGPIFWLLFVASNSLEYTIFWSLLNILDIALQTIIVIFFVGVRIKQIISRWHDLWLSWWYGFLNLFSLVTIILFFIPWQKWRNEYGEQK